jgi:hypothetical protein
MKIINTGCSYGVMFRSFKEFTKGNDVPFEIIDLHCDSHGAEYQKRSIIYTVSKLLKNGIKPCDILVISEFSQPNRLLIELPKEDAKHILSDTEYTEGTFILNNKFNRIHDSTKYVSKYKSLNVIFGDRVYVNPELNNLSEFSSKHRLYLESFNKKSPITHKPIDRYEAYLTNVFLTQSFLKSLNINHIFFLMNNVFEGYINELDHVYQNIDLHGLSFNDLIILPNLNHHLKIHQMSSYLNEIWNLIDFNHFVFYETDRFKYGGIDEYSMEKFGNTAYLATVKAEGWDYSNHEFATSFGAHPHDSVYVNFFIDFIYDKIKDYIGELSFDFSNRWSKTKHNAIRIS